MTDTSEPSPSRTAVGHSDSARQNERADSGGHGEHPRHGGHGEHPRHGGHGEDADSGGHGEHSGHGGHGEDAGHGGHGEHARHGGHGEDADSGGHSEALAELLELDARVLGGHLDDVTAWISRYIPSAPGSIVDVGAGTGTGTIALARRFPAATVLSVDKSAAMLDRVRAAAAQQGLDGRLATICADLDDGWPKIDAADLVWASSFLHEVADPGAVLRSVHSGLRPGGLLAVIEMDALPRFLSDDVGHGRPGLETRCHAALAEAGWNAHPDWREHLITAGFDVVGQEGFTIRADPATAPETGRLALAYFTRIRPALEGRLSAEDLSSVDRLLSAQGPEALERRPDLAYQSRRTVWAARRP